MIVLNRSLPSSPNALHPPENVSAQPVTSNLFRPWIGARDDGRQFVYQAGSLLNDGTAELAAAAYFQGVLDASPEGSRFVPFLDGQRCGAVRPKGDQGFEILGLDGWTTVDPSIVAEAVSAFVKGLKGAKP